MSARRRSEGVQKDNARSSSKAFMAGLDPGLTGGITFAKHNPSVAAVMRSEEELATIRLIVLREDIVAKIRKSLRRVESRFEVTDDLAGLLASARAATATACEAISAWKRQFVCVPCLAGAWCPRGAWPGDECFIAIATSLSPRRPSPAPLCGTASTTCAASPPLWTSWTDA